ncbi:MAG: hypothetical protein CMA64_00370 [Euryarchaeota archaeon]|jgi:uncharacterized protein HemX|nr:hypothetical protein [Euryarchaeota archaeon]
MKDVRVSDNTNVSMPIRNMIAIISAVALGVWAYFGVIEQINKHSTTLELMEKDLQANTEFRIKYPRGELGQSQNDLEQFMLIEELYKSVEKMDKTLESNMTNKVNIDFLKEQVSKMAKDIEKLKDKQRAFSNGNGEH